MAADTQITPMRRHGMMAELPEKFGKYHVQGVAGRGNMGMVYLGYDPFGDRDVAIKVSSGLDHLNENASRVAKKLFFNEAHMAGVLDHPNILKILDAGEEGGDLYSLGVVLFELLTGQVPFAASTLGRLIHLSTAFPTWRSGRHCARPHGSPLPPGKPSSVKAISTFPFTYWWPVT